MPAGYAHFNGDIRALPNDVLVINMERGDKLSKGGIIIRDDNGENRGIRARWAQVYDVGSKAAETCDYKKGQWIYIEHGRWTFGFDITCTDGTEIYVQKVELKSVLAVSDECPL